MEPKVANIGITETQLTHKPWSYVAYTALIDLRFADDITPLISSTASTIC
jgi:hypothetical protein